MGAQSNLSAALLLLAAAAASAGQCDRPNGWCVHPGSSYALKDCDGDGIADPVCSDSLGQYGVRQSSNNCADSWPHGHCTGESCHRSGGTMDMNGGWCVHGSSTFEMKDCDGDGVLDPTCRDTSGQFGILGSASQCGDSWPEGTCLGSVQQVSRDTSCHLLRGKTGEYLDRQHVGCNENELLNSFKVEQGSRAGRRRCFGDDMRTGIRCLVLRHVYNVAHRTTSCEAMHSKDMQYLERQNVACGSGEALQYYHLTPSGCEGDDFKYEFRCATVGGAGLGQEMVRHTACDHLDQQKAQYLDRQDVDCHNGEVITAFTVVRTGCSGEDMRYEYKCAAILSDACGIQNGDSSACADLQSISNNYVKCQAYINDCADKVPASAKAYKMRQCLETQKKCIARGFIDG